MKYCSNCGKEVEGETNFCPFCGKELSPSKNSNNNTTNVVINQNVNTGGNGKVPGVQNRNIATCIILSIVTCGIYGIVWFFSLVNDVNRVANDEKSSQSAGTVFLLTIVTCGIYGYIWFYNCGQRMHNAGKKHNIEIADNSLVYLLLMIFGLGIVDYAMIQSDLNKFAA